MRPPGPRDPSSKTPDWAVVVVLVEVAALAISLVIPLTPSRSGSEASLADLFVSDPTFFEQALTIFALTNLLVFFFGLAVFIKTPSGRSR